MGVVGAVSATSWLIYPRGREQAGRLWKISPSQGFDPRTVQPIASGYTDWAMPAHSRVYVRLSVCLSVKAKVCL